MRFHLHPAHPDRGDRWAGFVFDPSTALLVASGIGAGGSIMQGIGQSQAAGYNASVANMQGAADEQAAQARATQVQQQTQQEIGAAESDIGASGVSASSGSPLTVLSSLAAQGELNRQITLWQGKTQQIQQQNQGALDKWQGGQALMSGVFNGLGTAATGYYRSTMLSPPSNGSSPNFAGWG